MYVLILYVATAYSGVILNQEFTSKQNCETAANVVLKNSDHHWGQKEELTTSRYYACVPK